MDCGHGGTGGQAGGGGYLGRAWKGSERLGQNAKAQRMPPTIACKARGWCVGDHGWAPSPNLHLIRVWGATSESYPAHPQVRSRDISIEEWKGSETYSPTTAYGKTPSLSPPRQPRAPVRQPVPCSFLLCSYLKGREQWAGEGKACKVGHPQTLPSVSKVWTSWCL
jgi:hypothetical protein